MPVPATNEARWRPEQRKAIAFLPSIETNSFRRTDCKVFHRRHQRCGLIRLTTPASVQLCGALQDSHLVNLYERLASTRNWLCTMVPRKRIC